jgi:DNA modification methylase
MKGIKIVKLKDVKSNPNNPRIIKDDKFKKLVKSIQEFPEMLKIRPIVVNSDLIVLGGNMRLKACKDAGLKEIPIIIADELTDEQQREFIIKDNVGYGEWDWDMLKNEWIAEELEEWGLDVPEMENDLILEAEEDDYEVPDGGIETDIVIGDLFEIGEHRLLCGDSTDSDAVAKLMNGEKADMVFTDPPYNALKSWKKSESKSETRLDPSEWFANDNMEWHEFDQFLLDVFKFYNSHSVYICCDYRIYDRVKKQIEQCEYELKHCIVWKKNIWGLGKRYRFQHEFIVYVTKNKAPFFGDRSQSDVWEVDVDRKTEHKTPKPIGVPYIAIKNSSEKNGLIHDSFLGGGSTMLAAHQLKRKCYGMELDPKYCQVIIDRMKKLDPTLTIKRNGQII